MTVSKDLRPANLDELLRMALELGLVRSFEREGDLVRVQTDQEERAMDTQQAWRFMLALMLKVDRRAGARA